MKWCAANLLCITCGQLGSGEGGRGALQKGEATVSQVLLARYHKGIVMFRAK